MGDNATIANNRAGTANFGGGLYAEAAAKTTFGTYATFKNNTAAAGSAFYLTAANTQLTFST